ncbi:uncharacterized protein CANTADRAFT_45448 [Suhomyces tanzawaensis NRRL Y-17324]|uniref:Phospholipid/glycerol acyltransferase domain-containing protein n=1 Tax=Suhomyces tanzawaensis NRRL Y-17324 TaxID=984487 RepID=A0A1E4SQW9_9ASCO|nr:uncharacterized protein CANTADRAFT_45448 [Suhomyces tanzawaensis NRRL Y-17324]ODV81837.1 hypothetical protein CANTADRAFT_45448 [Suhomyces tanzawaensis NRRL Y-17324]
MARESRSPLALVRAALLGPMFILGCLSITITQYVGLNVLPDAELIQGMINLTKTQFVVLLTFITSHINPSKLAVTFDPNGSDRFRAVDGTLLSTLTPNSVLISNHQIYTDWFFHWYLSYTARLSNLMHIVLKDLSHIPVLGYGMKNFNFLFLSRKWEKDKVLLTNQLLTMDANARGLGPANNVKHVASTNIRSSPSAPDVVHWPQGENSNKVWPYQLILYPEGTVPSDRTKGRSKAYTAERNLPPLDHVLLPRIRGLFLTLRKLRNTAEVVYDLTTGYSQLKPDEYGELVFSLKRFYLLGKGPSQVNIFVKSWKVSEIPLGDETVDIDDAKEEDLKKFEDWLVARWYEKDRLLDTFYKTGSFGVQGTETVVADIKLGSQLEIFPVFVPLLILALLLRAAWVLLWKLV